MPMYEFDCADCGQPFVELVRSIEAIKDVTCPECGGAHIKKKMSSFASKIAGGSSVGSSYASAAACSPGGG